MELRMTTPRQEGYFMPAEWHPHSGCWMTWAASRETFGKAPLAPEEAYREAKKCYGQVAQAISRYEPVFMLTNKPDFEETRALCGPKVTIIEAQIDDGWFRDSGPTFVINESGDIAGVNWVFNGWGGRYPHGKDDEAAGKLLSRLGIKQFESPLVLEGGGIHVDGQGTLLVTESCQLNKNRNPDLSKAQVEEYLREYLNVGKIIWLNGFIPADMTDGHIDGLACFIRPGVVLAASPPDDNHPDYDVLQENLEILRNSTDAKDRPIEVVEMVAPYRHLDNGMILDACYLNFYIANGGVIVPSYNFQEEDRLAYAIFKKQFPKHEIIQLDTEVIHYGGGNIHCITQQQPKVSGIK
jgi:agmatine deiminase